MKKPDINNYIPAGFVEQPDGSYSKMKTAQAHNLEAGVGHVEISVGGSAVKSSAEIPPTTVARLAARPSTDEDGLNKTERAWLTILRNRGYAVRIQAIKLKLADNCTYCPDFSAIVDGRLIFWEVKGGFIREDGWLKLKIAARQYPEFVFTMAQYKAKAWTEKVIPV